MTATAFCLHALGSSSEEFATMRTRLAGTLDLIGIDLPGFGRSSAATGTSVEEMVERVERAVGRSGATEWVLIGHSMGGKVASVVASRTIDGSNGLFGLRAVVLLAASPLSPEPMDDERRKTMLDWAADGEIGADEADTFVTANTDGPLPPEPSAMAVHDVQRADPRAWTDWLVRGSREDWSAEFPPNPVPALVLAGASDGDLGPEAQRTLNLPHWPNGEFDVVPGAAHLLPWERPDQVAERIRAFWERRVAPSPVVPPTTVRVIASPRVSARTRGILAVRALADDPGAEPRVLSAQQLTTLRAVARVVVPQDGLQVDLALRVDAQLAAGAGDGWRPDGLPVDVEAYRAGLDALAPEADRGDVHLTAVLDAVTRGEHEPAAGSLDAAQLQAWAEDASVDLVKQWVAHPATMAEIDYDGFANGGDGVRKQGFLLLGAGQREAWEPAGATR
ncbi:alpha/beta fold hydrolase [Curtobacterium sp. VKM Ac-2922]|uniref:alpha/beta fold hydrolase n=1 Tax=Curtobacterium sp. VKM Ac-2922 TaxID=2929475 RepID=UPI001FB41406|nr:alpha/beta hydrolase [Curtobacterium sp. VKM Ac-2922]MCJ1715154.1 alpha/beta hydrolase [Curtobacterium sp. VKM Ac-2922]